VGISLAWYFCLRYVLTKKVVRASGRFHHSMSLLGVGLGPEIHGIS
jgi:hypothetical protein